MGYSYLNFINFSSLSNWNIKHITYNHNSQTRYDMVDIKKVIKRTKTNVLVENNKYYKRITIKINGKGVHVRDIQVGEKIKTKNQYKVSEGQLVISKIDARNGAFGIVPKEANGSIITGNFWAYDVDKTQVNIHYLLFVLSSSYFTEKWFVCSNGSGNRLYLQEELFLSTQIPLPPLRVQERLITEYEDKIKKSNILIEKSNKLYSEIDTTLFDDLGIEQIKLSDDKSKSYLKEIDYYSLVNWGVQSSSGDLSPTNILVSARYDNKTLGSFARINPTTDFSNLKKTDYITFLPMECISDTYGEIIEKRQITVEASKGYTKFQENDIIWAKITPCMENGKSAIVSELNNEVGCGSTEFHVIRTGKALLNSYVYYILRTKIVRQVATDFFSGSAGQQRVSSDYLQSLVIPIPPIDIQSTLAEKLSKMRQEVKELNFRSDELKTEARKTLEEEIFSE